MSYFKIIFRGLLFIYFYFVYVQADMNACVNVCESLRLMSSVAPQLLSTLFLEKGSLTNMNFIGLARLASHGNPRIYLFLPSHCLAWRHVSPHQTFMWVLGSELRSSCFCRTFLTDSELFMTVLKIQPWVFCFIIISSWLQPEMVERVAKWSVVSRRTYRVPL